MSFNKFFILMLTLVITIYTIGFKVTHTMGVKVNTHSDAYDLIREQDDAGKETTYNDAEIIVSKIFPKSTFRYAINPFVWTRKQMSENDALLQACIDANDRDDIKDKAKLTRDMSTFESRFSEWEINLEKAKESIK
jgi:hypothetical protein